MYIMMYVMMIFIFFLFLIIYCFLCVCRYVLGRVLGGWGRLGRYVMCIDRKREEKKEKKGKGLLRFNWIACL